MTTQPFSYEKSKVIQALRYHFISRPEIKIMIVLVNVFAIGSALLFFFHKVSPLAFLVSSLMWFFLMILFWFILPMTIFKKERTFKDNFTAYLSGESFAIESSRGTRSWPWTSFSNWMETPHFYHLYFNSRSFFLVPKDAFPGDEVHDARKMLQQKISKK